MRILFQAFFIKLAVFVLVSNVVSETLPPALADAGIDEQLGKQVDMTLLFKDEFGKEITLGNILNRGKPVLLNFAYFHCPMLCGLVQQGMIKGMKGMEWTPGQEYTVLTVGMDSREGPTEALAAKNEKILELGKKNSEAGWSFITGSSKNIKALASTVGFKFNFLPAANEYAHGAGLIFLTSEGIVSRYLYGIEFTPRDLRLALLDASEGRLLSIGDRFAMFCYRYDANAKGYVLFARTFMKVGGIVVISLMGLLLIPLWRREMGRKERSGVEIPTRV